MAATISVSAGELRVLDRTMLFELSPGTLVGDRTTQYDVSADGRFLMLRNATAGDADADPRLILVKNFLEEVKARVGSGG